jgi:glycolate oxidase FAD binding subunit
MIMKSLSLPIDDVRLIISKKIKESFDPKRILNPGKMYRGV